MNSIISKYNTDLEHFRDEYNKLGLEVHLDRHLRKMRSAQRSSHRSVQALVEELQKIALLQGNISETASRM
jgi:hypothetical protein